MIDFAMAEKALIVDMGCSIGYLTRPLSLRAQTVGLDIDKRQLQYAKASYRDIDFVCCDLCHLPLKNDSVNLAVCVSVFEHIENLCEAVKEIKSVLKKGGKLGVGYPIETRFIELIIKSFWRFQSHVWDQSNITKHKERLTDPHVHKQLFPSIRRILRADFTCLKQQKIPNKYIPDSLSIYENVILVRNESK